MKLLQFLFLFGSNCTVRIAESSRWSFCDKIDKKNGGTEND